MPPPFTPEEIRQTRTDTATVFGRYCVTRQTTGWITLRIWPRPLKLPKESTE